MIILAKNIEVLKSHPFVMLENPSFFHSICQALDFVPSFTPGEDNSIFGHSSSTRDYGVLSRILTKYETLKCFVICNFFKFSSENLITFELSEKVGVVDRRLREMREIFEMEHGMKDQADIGSDNRNRLAAEITTFDNQMIDRQIERYIITCGFTNKEFTSCFNKKGVALLRALSTAYCVWFSRTLTEKNSNLALRVLISCFDIDNKGVYTIAQRNAIFRFLEFHHPVSSCIQFTSNTSTSNDIYAVLHEAQYSPEGVLAYLVQKNSAIRTKVYRHERRFVDTYVACAMYSQLFIPNLELMHAERNDELLRFKKQLLAMAQESEFSTSTLGKYRVKSIADELHVKLEEFKSKSSREYILEYIFYIFRFDDRGFLSTELPFVRNCFNTKNLQSIDCNSLLSTSPFEELHWIDWNSYVKIFGHLAKSFSMLNFLSQSASNDSRLKLQAIVRQESLLSVCLEDMNFLQYIIRVNALSTVSNRFHVISTVISWWSSVENISLELFNLWMDCEGVSDAGFSDFYAEQANYRGPHLRCEPISTKSYREALNSHPCTTVMVSKIRKVLWMERRKELRRLDRALMGWRGEIERLTLVIAEQIVSGGTTPLERLL